MREGYEACQISLLYVLFSLFGHDGAQRSIKFLSFCFFFYCFLLLLFFSQRCINLSFQLNQDKLRHR